MNAGRQIVFGVLLILSGLVFGVYVGIWVMFIGGIVDILNQIRAEVLEPIVIAIAIVKIIAAGFVGQLCAVILVLPGIILLGKGLEK